jgi:hypothetical protein
MRLRCVYLSVLTIAIALVVMSQPARASQIAYEGFSLTFPAYNSGTGFSGAWAQGGFNAFASGYTASESSLSYATLQTSGGSVSGGAFPAINGAIRHLALSLGADNTTVYLSFLIRPQGTLNDGIFNGFFGLTLNGSLGNDLFIGKPGGGAETQYVLETRGGSGQIPSGTSAVVGQTALLVVKAQFLSGNDIFTLYVNPAPGGSEPASATVKTDLDLGIVSVLGIYSTGAFAVDEIRVGTTYADVTPQSPFAGTPGAANCHGKTVSALAQTYGGLANASSALGYASVADLQNAITSYCGN